MIAYYAPPSPEPEATPSDELATPSPTTTMTTPPDKLPVTGIDDGAGFAMFLGIGIVALGVALLVFIRRLRSD